MDITDFLAMPGAHSIRLIIGPRVTDQIFIDQGAFDARKGEFLAFCRGIPHINDGPSWQLLKVHTEGNGQMAKVLIALGEVAGAWKMHPSPLHPELWHNNSYPMVLAGSVVNTEAPRRVPKPSAGDLDAEGSCKCCGRPMGPVDSWKHDLVASPYADDTCYECEEEQCDPEGECKLGFSKRKTAETLQPGAEPGDAPDGLEAYLNKFGD